MLTKFSNLLCEAIATEGGNAVPDVERIEQRYIYPTAVKFCHDVLDNFVDGDSTKYAFFLGSTGKNPDSGDIDIGIALDRLNEESVLKNLVKIKNFCESNGIVAIVNSVSWDMVHVAFEQVDAQNNPTGKKVQIDVIITEHPKFLQWFMRSPSKKESEYKSAHRNILYSAILRAHTLKPLLTAEDGEVLKWQALSLNQNGIFDTIMTLVDKRGKKLKYKDTNEDLLPEYAKAERESLVTADPDEAINIIFDGKDISQDDMKSFETLYAWINENMDDSEKIFEEACYLLKGQEKRLVMPQELKKYVKLPL